MDNKKAAYLACDTAYEQGVVTLFTDDTVIVSEVMAEKMAHGKHICRAIDVVWKAALAEDLEVKGFFCGLGPGSFVGIRVALATVLGFSFARALPVMGFCSHEAIANSFSDEKNLVIFMKASGDLGYLTTLSRANNIMSVTKPTEVIAISDVVNNLSPNAVLCSDQADKLAAILSVPLAPVLGPTAVGIQQVCLHRLRQLGSFVDESASIKPNYVKAPNVSLPKRAIVIDPQAH